MCRFNFKVLKVAQKLGWVKTLTNKSQGLQYTHSRTTMAMCIPKSLRPKFKSQSKTNIWGVDKGLVFCKNND